MLIDVCELLAGGGIGFTSVIISLSFANYNVWTECVYGKSKVKNKEASNESSC